MHRLFRSGLATAILPLVLLLGGCSRTADTAQPAPAADHPAQVPAKSARPTEHQEEAPDLIRLSDAQIAAAGIEVMPVRRGFAGALDALAVLVADPQKTGIVAASVGGRVVELRHNLGDEVARGEVLAVIESQDAAQLKAELATSQRQLELAQSTLQREEYLLREKVSAEQDYQAARTAQQQAQISADLARQRLSASGGSVDGPLNRLTIRSPIKGFVTARQIALGDVISANTELFRVADLREIAVEFSLSPDDASHVAVGAAVAVSTNGRTGSARIVALSRVIDPATLQVRAVALLPNPLGAWRIGETVRASVLLAEKRGGGQLAVPRSAIQTVEDKPSAFVRVKEGFAVKHLVLGQASAGYVVVASGLEGDERVATSNSFVLKAELGKGEGGDHEH